MIGNARTKLALVIGGGAIRGAVSMGMLAALEAMGANSVFDDIYGASAGAANGASFLAEQCRTHVLAYPHELASKRFLRVTARGLYADVGFVRDVMVDKYKLDIRRIQAHKTKLHIAATEVASGSCTWFTNHQEEGLTDLLMASAALPAFYNKPVMIHGKGYLDGGIVEPLPVAKAIADGATHVLVLSTVPEGYRHEVRSKVLERWASRRVRIHGEAFGRTFAERQEKYNASLAIAFGRERTVLHHENILTVSPHATIPAFERSKKKIMEASWHGFAKMVEAL